MTKRELWNVMQTLPESDRDAMVQIIKRFGAPGMRVIVNGREWRYE